MTVFSRCTLAAIVSVLSVRADNAACVINMPCYSTASIVNSASYATGWLGPNTFASIFGWNLTDGITAGGAPGSQGSDGSIGGVRVMVNGAQPAFVSFISPHQVNLVIPTDLLGDTATVQLVNNGKAGPKVTLAVHDSAPALFLGLDGITATAIHSDGTLVTAQSPAHAGELVRLYATGLGPFARAFGDFNRPSPPDPIARRAEFSVQLDGQTATLSPSDYVGATAAWVGVVEINFHLPAGVGRNPEVRIGLGDRLSPPGTFLPVQ
jgi:uncharacterized protein (TIGR03437 family)